MWLKSVGKCICAIYCGWVFDFSAKWTLGVALTHLFSKLPSQGFSGRCLSGGLNTILKFLERPGSTLGRGIVLVCSVDNNYYPSAIKGQWSTVAILQGKQVATWAKWTPKFVKLHNEATQEFQIDTIQ